MDTVIKKIQKLLALSQSPNENEAAAAMQKVQLLLAENNLSMNDVKGEEAKVVEEYKKGWERISLWRQILHAAVESTTFTNTIYEIGTKRMIIVGREANVTAAINLHEYLSEAVLRVSRKLYRAGYNRNSVRLGMALRIEKRLKELQCMQNSSEETAIVVHATANAERENNTFIESTHGELGKLGSITPDLDRASFRRGEQAGDDLSLHDQIIANNYSTIEA